MSLNRLAIVILVDPEKAMEVDFETGIINPDSNWHQFIPQDEKVISAIEDAIRVSQKYCMETMYYSFFKP